MIEKTKQKENKISKYLLSILVSILLIGIASAQSSTNTTVVTNSICPVVASFGGFGVFEIMGILLIMAIGGFGLFQTYKRQVKEASEKDTAMNYNTMIEIAIGMVILMIFVFAITSYFQTSLKCPAITSTTT